MNNTKLTSFSSCLIATLFVLSCVERNSEAVSAIPDTSKTESTPLFPRGDRTPLDKFSGVAYLQPLLARNDNNNFVMGSVTFEPGARSNWHSHPKGQVLIILEGEGLNQERGKPVQRLKKGDVVNIPANVPHWHGATATAKMVHIAITNYEGDTNAVWLNQVTEEEYQSSNNQ